MHSDFALAVGSKHEPPNALVNVDVADVGMGAAAEKAEEKMLNWGPC